MCPFVPFSKGWGSLTFIFLRVWLFFICSFHKLRVSTLSLLRFGVPAYFSWVIGLTPSAFWELGILIFPRTCPLVFLMRAKVFPNLSFQWHKYTLCFFQVCCFLLPSFWHWVSSPLSFQKLEILPPSFQVVEVTLSFFKSWDFPLFSIEKWTFSSSWKLKVHFYFPKVSGLLFYISRGVVSIFWTSWGL